MKGKPKNSHLCAQKNNDAKFFFLNNYIIIYEISYFYFLSYISIHSINIFIHIYVVNK